MNGMILTLGNVDERLLLALVLRRRRLIDRLMRTITHLADPAAVITLTAALMWKATADLHAAGVRAALALTVSHLAVQLLKRTIVRPRPRLPAGLDFLVTPPDRFSFPSGHAAAALSLALPIALALPTLAGAAVLVVAGVVGLSRCYLGLHYPGDVLAGWILGCLGVLGAALLVSVPG